MVSFLDLWRTYPGNPADASAPPLAKVLARVEANGAPEIVTAPDTKTFLRQLFARTGILVVKDRDDATGGGDRIELWNGHRSRGHGLGAWVHWAEVAQETGDTREIRFWPLS